jgi:hypothetical protein
MQNKMIKELKTTSGKSLEIEAYYSKGGMNYFTSNNEPRGYYLGITPVEKSATMRVTTAFSGTKVLILGAKRFSAKVLADLNPDDKQVQDILNHVLQKNNLMLAK